MGKRSIVHFEIPAEDRKAASKFYGELFGWSFQHLDEMNYTTFDTGNVGGGLNPLGDMVKPGDLVIYIESEDIEADLKKIEDLGGKTILPKTEIPGIGWFAFFANPTGNQLALYTDMTGG